MSRQPREVYGFGKALPTRRGGLPRLAAIALVAIILGVLAGVLWK